MRAIEFIAHAENGVIKVPKKYQSQISGSIRIIILQDEVIDTLKPSKKKVLLLLK